MKKISYLFGLLVLILVSCSEDNSVNNSKLAIFPTGQGSYWIYDTEFFNIDGEEIDTSKDSVVVAGEQVKDGKTGIKFNSYVVSEGQPVLNESILYATEKDKLFIHSDYLLDQFAMFPISFDEIIRSEWLQVLNREDDFWKVSEYEINDFVVFPGIAFDGDIMITGERDDNEIINSMNRDFTCEKYVLNFEIDGTFKTEQGDFPLSLELNVDFYFSEGVGLVKRHISSWSISIPLMGEIEREGSTQILTNFKLN